MKPHHIFPVVCAFFLGAIVGLGASMTLGVSQTADTPSPGPAPVLGWLFDSAAGVQLQYAQGHFDLHVGNDPKYPIDSTLVMTTEQVDPAPVRSSLVLDTAPYAGTNLYEAWVAVAAHTPRNPKDVIFCEQYRYGTRNVPLSKTTTINGVAWKYDTFDSAAAGTSIATTVYHTTRPDGTCIELSASIAEGNIGNYDPGTVKEFDKAAVTQRLVTIIESATL
jgi:hypothetical protein